MQEVSKTGVDSILARLHLLAASSAVARAVAVVTNWATVTNGLQGVNNSV